jgi:hypothetical protein
VGSYAIADGASGSWSDDDSILVAYAAGPDGNQYRCISTSSSTLKITSSTTAVVAGSFEATVQCHRTPEGGSWTTTTVKGSFSAKHDTSVTPDNPV